MQADQGTTAVDEWTDVSPDAWPQISQKTKDILQET